MKTTDLMIGDLVLVLGKLSKVIEIREHSVLLQGRSFYFGETNIEPILLTKEILDKNKFPYAPKADGYFVGNLFLRGNDNIGYSVGANIRIDNGDGIVSGMYYTFGKIRYVHELQHLLKFCGIEKEIIL